MKKLLSALLFVALLHTASPLTAQSSEPLWQGKGRIAVSSDGNEHDDDDWAATPLTLALLASQGLQDAVTLYTYSDHVWGSNVDKPNHNGMSAYEHMHKSALGSQKWFAFDDTKFICAVDDPQAAYKAMAKEINASSEKNPLIIIAAGPMQVVGSALELARKSKRKYVTVVSHSNWNDRHSAAPHEGESHTGWTWDKMKEQFEGSEGGSANFVKILNQNGGKDYIGLYCEREHYDWIKTSPARNSIYYKVGAWDFLYERISSCIKRKGTCYDPSDAGMVVYMLTGEQETNPEMVRKLMENPRR